MSDRLPDRMIKIRAATPADAKTCATILNDWIDTTPWMPRVHPHDDVERHYREFVLPFREVLVAGDPVCGFIAIDSDEAFVTALYVRNKRQGIGSALLDEAKRHRNALSLWTFQANTAAQRFYLRHGFREICRTEGDNEEELPDILYKWER